MKWVPEREFLELTLSCCFLTLISVRLWDCPWAGSNLSSLFITETLSLDWPVCGVKDGCSTQHQVLERHAKLRLKELCQGMS